jgi:hypothetical protein
MSESSIQRAVQAGGGTGAALRSSRVSAAAAEVALMVDVGAGVGASPDNMAPTNAIIDLDCTDKIHVLSFGIDSLDINLYGELSENFLLLSEMAKEDAQDSPIREDLSPLPPFLGHNLMMQAKGGRGIGGYEFLARSDDLTVRWKKPNRFKVAPMVVEFSSALLWRLGGGGWSAVAAVLDWVREIDWAREVVPATGEVVPGRCEVRVSNFHQCADVQGWVPELVELGGIVKRADSLDVWNDDGKKYEEEGLSYRLAKGDKLGTVAAGRSNRLRASIYDKTKELKKSGKEWFRDVWGQHASYNPDLPVWRTEFQYGREFLHKYRVETLEDLRKHQDALFRYGLAWFSWRERQVSDLNHPQRWPLIPAWVALGLARPVSEPLPLARVVQPKLKQLAQMADGVLGTFMAMTGETDPVVALERLQAIVRLHKGAEGMQKVLAKKRERYLSTGASGDWAGRQKLGDVAEVARPGGEGFTAIYARWMKWGDGFIGSAHRRL